MPRRGEKAPAVEPMEVEEDGQDVEMDEAQALQFDQPITWRPGKPIVVSELLRRLKTLSEELATMDQEDADREALVPKAQELASAQLLSHKDKGVKAYAMMCIVEMFRLLAPDAPYKGGQLKEIFTLFTSTIIPALASPTDPYNQQHNFVLASLTNVKSIVLITDIAGSDNLLLNLFTNCFDVLAGGGKNGTGERLPKNLEYHMTNMLCTVVDETEVLPSGVVDIILAQFLRADPTALSTANKKGESASSILIPELPPAYNMARAVCNTCSDKLERNIGQYFTSVLIDISENLTTAKIGKMRGKKRTHDESEDESDDGLLTPPAEHDMEEVEKAHRLLRELWRSCPDVIRNIVPQIEAEAQAESAWLRAMAVRTLGDMISGIGAAGLPPPETLDPAAYPSQSLDESEPTLRQPNPLLTPNAPHAFSSVYPSAYLTFTDRCKDKAAVVRSAWATEAGRIIQTSGGGKGLDEDQEKTLLLRFSTSLLDNDERVRLAAIHAIAQFDFTSIVQKIGKSGSVALSGSVLCCLADRIKDKRHVVRAAATELLGRIWGVAAGAIAEGNERIHAQLGVIPSRIFHACYVNDREVNTLVQRVLYDCLLPTTFPPIKARQQSSGDSQRVDDSQVAMTSNPDPDAVRAERILVLVRDLDERAQRVFFSQQNKRPSYENYLAKYLQLCEDANSNNTDTAKDAKKKLDKYVDAMLKNIDLLPDLAVAAEHLKKFAKHHDRRSYQLIRFCYSADSDYRKIFKAMKELTKRIEEAPSGMAVVLETLIPLVRSAAVLVYNKSHVPAIVEFSRTDDKGLGSAAHEVLKEISARAPGIFKVHVHELCETLKKQTPGSTVETDEAVVDTLKACAGFARQYPSDMPQDRDFFKAMVDYSVRGMPPKVAKHAVTVVVSAAAKKEMYVKEIEKACVEKFKYGEEGFLSKLASMSQLRLVANLESEDHAEAMMEIAISQVLGQVRAPAECDDEEWLDEVDDDLSAKIWALRILVNGLRGYKPGESEESSRELKEKAQPVYQLLNTLIQKDGELSKSSSTPKNQKAHLRLAAAVQLLKLSCNRTFDSLLTQSDFNQLSKIAQDETKQVRAGFATALKKYLGAGALGNRFYGLVFLYAFEPDKPAKDSTITWLKSRAAMSARNKDNIMEASFPRFLSLLAHHQDFSTETEHLKDFVEYIMFYLKNVATEANLPLIYHFAQRLKTVQDGIDPEKSENLYILSDIAEAVIRQYQDVQGWSLQVMSGRVGLPSGLFSKLPSHAVAQDIADKRYIPDDLVEDLEDLVRSSLKTKKRKTEGTTSQLAKKPKPAANGTTAAKKPSVRESTKVVRTPKKKREDPIPSSERRKSTRQSNAKSYAEHDDSEDDDELEQWQEDDDDDVDDEANKENVESTPPTSDPPPAGAPPKEVEAEPVLTKKDSGKKTRAKPSTIGPASSPKSAPKAAHKVAATRPTRATRLKKVKDVYDIDSD
jgi:sister-chromatid-cohesion protein PDS5